MATKLTLTPEMNQAITEAFRRTRPRSMLAKVRVIQGCEAIHPRPTHEQACSLLSQRRTMLKRQRRSRQAQPEQEQAFKAMKAARPDIYE